MTQNQFGASAERLAGADRSGQVCLECVFESLVVLYEQDIVGIEGEDAADIGNESRVPGPGRIVRDLP